MAAEWLDLIAAGSGDEPPQRWGGPFAHRSDLTAEELADWTECDDAPEMDGADERGAHVRP